MTLPRIALLTLLAGGLHAQALAFEVASVKPAPPGTPSGGGGGRGVTPPSPRTVNYPNITLKDLIRRAWKVTDPQVSGPAWMDTERYSVIAKMPDGANQGDIPRMLQPLLAERFHLALHHEERPIAIFAMVPAKGGAKIKAGDDTALQTEAVKNPSWAERIESSPPGTSLVNIQKGHMLCKQIELAKFAEGLVKEMGRPVFDRTEMSGRFSFVLDWVRENPIVPQTDEGIGLPLPQALEAQLGLRLEKRNLPSDVLVIDRVEKVPTGN